MTTQEEPSILNERLTQEYSDLFAVSGNSFLSPIDQNTLNSINIQTNPTGSPPPPPPTTTTTTTELIDLTTPKRRNYQHELEPVQTRTIRTSDTLDLMDHSISSFELLPKALSPSTPSSRRTNHLLLNQISSPHLHWTPPTSPKPTHKILSPHLTHPSTPDRPKSVQPSNITRTHSVDLLGLYDHHTPRPPISRSKSTTAIKNHEEIESKFLPSDHHSQQQQQHPKPTKSILKRPNSPSKGTRARFFSPRVLSDHTGDEESDGNESSWIDEQGNCRGREIIHEFQKDEPPMTRPKSILKPSAESPSPRKIPPSSSSISRRQHHTPKFIIPEPIDLGIEPILPRHSTSPSPSPPSLPPASYLMNARVHRKTPLANTQASRDQQQPTRSASNSLIFNTPDNLSNIMDESGGFFIGNETTWTGGDSNNNKERSTELSIDLNHVAMMELLGKRNLAKLRPGSAFAKLNSTRNSECIMVPEEEEEEQDSIDVSGLARQLENKKSGPSDNLSLKDEQAPVNLRGSLDFSTTFESSKINLPPLPTDRDQLWKNSQPKEQKNPLTTDGLTSAPMTKRYSMSSIDHRILGERGEMLDEVTARLKTKIDSIKLSAQEDTRSVMKDDLFSELMSAPPPSVMSHADKKTIRPAPVHSKTPRPPPSSGERQPTAAKRLSGPVAVAFPGGNPTQPKITATNPVGKPRTSCISTSVTPVRAKRSSNIGIGLPPSSSAPSIHSLCSKLSKPSTTGLTGVRTKLKPSNALVKPALPSGSPKTMKSRSSLSTISLNSPRVLYQANTKKPSVLAHPPTTTARTKIISPTKSSKTLPVPGTTNTLPAPRPYATTGSARRSSLLEGPPPRSALPQPASLSNRHRTAHFSSATTTTAIARPPSSKIVPPSSEPSKNTLYRQIKQTL